MIEVATPRVFKRLCGEDSFELNLWGIVFLVIVTLETLVLIGCCVANIVLNALTDKLITQYFFSVLVILLMLIMLYFAYDAVINENQFQLIAFTLACFIMTARFVYGYIAYHEFQKVPFLIAGITVFVAQVGYIILSIPLVKSFGWRMFHIVGTNSSLITMYRNYMVFASLIKFDLTFALQVGLMGFFFVQFKWEYLSYVGLGVGLSLTFIAAPLVVYLGVKAERGAVCIIFFVWSLAYPGYLIYKIISVWLVDNLRTIGGGQNDDIAIKALLTAVAVGAILTRALLLIWVIVIMRQFNKGLKKVFLKQKKKREEKERQPLYYRP